MLLPENDERRPGRRAALNVNVGNDDESNDTRCERCSRPIWAARSVRVGCGPRCERIRAAEAVAA